MATSVIIRDVGVGGYPSRPPFVQLESASVNSSGEYCMMLSSGEQEQKNAATSGPTMEEKLVAWRDLACGMMQHAC
ncbi:unnamed protein product [Symbiodinium natans]|uniref:Uncharacterized protein n=1 Tax=Symbiodinium natans TaxID=878477 RepID=A0A812QPA0_9DINO|nr:unnamed protein product [Symbiodinium natans]